MKKKHLSRSLRRVRRDERVQCSCVVSRPSELVFAFFSWRGGLWGGYNFCGPCATPWTLTKDARVPWAVQAVERILPAPIPGGSHHQYMRF